MVITERVYGRTEITYKYWVMFTLRTILERGDSSMHLLDISDLSLATIEALFRTAEQLEQGVGIRLKPLNDTSWVLFFPESSLRTRMTFEKAIAELGGQSMLFPPNTLDKQEALKDVIGYMQNWADGIVVRHSDYEKVKLMANFSIIPVINAMTAENHPCEILSDLYAIRKLRPEYKTLTYTFVGENGNISRSWASAAKVMGLRLNHVCTEGNRIWREASYYHFTTDLNEVLPETDILLTDGLPGCNKNDAYYEAYQITEARLKKAKKGVLLNPCPPFTRGEELSIDAIESDAFVGYDFKKSLLWVQQAILLCSRGIELKEVL